MKLYIEKEGCSNDYSKYLSLCYQSKSLGYEIINDVKDADCIVCITCICYGQRALEYNKSRIMSLKSERKDDAIILIGGCLSKLKGFNEHSFFGMDLSENNIYCHNGNDWFEFFLLMLKRLIQSKMQIYKASNYVFHHGNSATLHIQSGCDYRCSYCKVHVMDFKSRSLTYDEIIKDTEMLLDNGITSISLFAHSILLCGKDHGDPNLFIKIIEKLSSYDSLKHLILGAVTPATITKEELNTIKYSTKIRKIYLSAQSGNNRILGLMNRGGLDATYKFVEEARANNPDLFIESELIAGFPTETLEELNDTISMVKKLKLWVPENKIHAYENIIGTPSSLMEQLSDDIIAYYWHMLANAVNISNQAILEGYLNKEYMTTIISKNNDYAVALLPFSQKTMIPLENCLETKIAEEQKVMLIGVDHKSNMFSS